MWFSVLHTYMHDSSFHFATPLGHEACLMAPLNIPELMHPDDECQRGRVKGRSWSPVPAPQVQHDVPARFGRRRLWILTCTNISCGFTTTVPFCFLLHCIGPPELYSRYKYRRCRLNDNIGYKDGFILPVHCPMKTLGKSI